MATRRSKSVARLRSYALEVLVCCALCGCASQRTSTDESSASASLESVVTTSSAEMRSSSRVDNQTEPYVTDTGVAFDKVIELERADRQLRGPIFFKSEALDHHLHDESIAHNDQRLPDDWMAIHNIDVGQGDAFLIEFACAAMLVDTGGERTEVEEGVTLDGRDLFRDYVTRFFQRRPDLNRTFDLVVISHPHQDHAYGATWLAERVADTTPGQAITVRHYVDAGVTWPTPANRAPSGLPEVKQLRAALRAAGVKLYTVTIRKIESASDPMGLTGPDVNPLKACGNGPDPVIHALWGKVSNTWQPKNENNHSVVLRLDFGESSILFTGDLQKEGIREMIDGFDANPAVFDVDVLKVGHHGSHNATTLELVELTSPEVALIGVGDKTFEVGGYTAFSFGHPHRAAIDALLDETLGVSGTRTPIQVEVGVRGAFEQTPSEFEPRTVERAVFATGWDGDVVLFMSAQGEIRVETSR